MEDLHELGWSHIYKPAILSFQHCSKIDEEHYPELLRKVILINTPRIFKFFFNLLKSMVDTRTLEKIEVVGSDYLPVLEKYIDPINIPKEHGGKCDRHTMCLPSGGKFVPKSRKE